MKILARYIHGSADSTDTDVLYVVDAAPDFRKCQVFCAGDPAENRNIATIENGRIAWCYKGFPDEVNNSVRATYPLHGQDFPLLMTRPAERDVPLKLLSVLRKQIMELRHTTLRDAARAALKKGYSEREELLRSTDLRTLRWEIPEDEQIERRKSMAFQLAQGIALYEGAELYTKKELAEHFPSLRPYLYREPCSAEALEEVKNKFLRVLSSMGFTDVGNMTVLLPGDPERRILLKGKEQDI